MNRLTKTVAAVALMASASWIGATLQAHAQGFQSGFEEVGNIENQSGITVGNDPVAFIGKILNVLLSFVGIIAVIAIIYGGVMYITSAGDEQRAGRGKTIILYAVIGLIIVGISGIVVNIIISTYSA